MEFTPIDQLWGGLALLAILLTTKIVVYNRKLLNSLLLAPVIFVGGLFILVTGTQVGGMLFGLGTVVVFCLPIIIANYGKLS